MNKKVVGCAVLFFSINLFCSEEMDLKPRGKQSEKDITVAMEAILKYGSNTEYFPVIESGGAFREKFSKIENFLKPKMHNRRL